MTKHKVFISYYHKDDEEYKNKFEDLFEVHKKYRGNMQTIMPF